MNLWFRLLWLLLRSPWRPRLSAPDGVSRIRSRVWFNDLDVNGHMNNGRYWTLFDLGRIDLILRNGIGRAALKRKWAPIVGAGAVRFRRELRLFQRFTLETRVLGWQDARMVMQQRVLIGEDEVVATRALLLAGFYDRRARRFVTAEDLLGAVGVRDAVSPALNEPSRALFELDAALKDDAAQDRD